MHISERSSDFVAEHIEIIRSAFHEDNNHNLLGGLPSLTLFLKENGDIVGFDITGFSHPEIFRKDDEGNFLNADQNPRVYRQLTEASFRLDLEWHLGGEKGLTEGITATIHKKSSAEPTDFIKGLSQKIAREAAALLDGAHEISALKNKDFSRDDRSEWRKLDLIAIIGSPQEYSTEKLLKLSEQNQLATHEVKEVIDQ